jgi:tellurite resistance protein TerC
VRGGGHSQILLLGAQGSALDADGRWALPLGRYRVHAFGFELLGDFEQANETLSVYDASYRLLGVLTLGQPAGTPAGPASGSTFVGLLCEATIGFASFDELELDSDEIGVAGFVFGYKEYEAGLFPPMAWLLFLAPTAAILLLEDSRLRRLGPMGLRGAVLWLLLWSAVAAAGACALWGLRGWRQSSLFTFCFSLNGLLSGDNLFVFMLLLQQSGLHEQHHALAVSHGMLGALGMRILLSLAGAALLHRFAWIILLFAGVLLATGLKMLVAEPAPSLEAKPAADDAAGGDSVATRCLGRCVPLIWSDATEARYLARDAEGRLCATRMAVVVLAICFADVIFAMDSVPVVLSLTTSPFLLVASQTVSLLWLRPLYFLVVALASYVDSMQQMLALVLILIALKIFAEAAGFEVPISAFVALLFAARVAVVALSMLRRRAAAGRDELGRALVVEGTSLVSNATPDGERRRDGVDGSPSPT